MNNLYWKLHRKYTLRFRRSRFDLFKQLVSKEKRPLRILDIGGTRKFWEDMNFHLEKDVEIVLLNLWKVPVVHPNFKSVVGDGRDLKEFEENEFGLVFSNSVIEHVGSFDDQTKFASEVKRVGRSYYLQTPNRYFPIEPHVIFPFFQFLPLNIKAFFVSHFNMGWFNKISDYAEAKKVMGEIRLLKKKEVKIFFPGANIYEEKAFGLTKSFVVYKTTTDSYSVKKNKLGDSQGAFSGC